MFCGGIDGGISDYPWRGSLVITLACGSLSLVTGVAILNQ